MVHSYCFFGSARRIGALASRHGKVPVMTIDRHRARRSVCAVLALAAFVTACGTPANVEQVLQQARSASPATSSALSEPDPRAESGGTAAVAPSAEQGASDAAGSEGPGPSETSSATPDTDPGETAGQGSSTEASASGPADQAAAGPTIAFAGDVNFAERTADRLAADPTTAFGVAAPGLAAADLTVVNLETAITTNGEPEPKSFTFRAPPTALTALRAAGVDVASMANNHGADYGATGLADSVSAIAESGFPVIGIGADDAQAMAPYRTTIKGVDVTIFAASAVHDHTMQAWTATGTSPGIASAFDPRLVDNVRAAAVAGQTVIVFLHWGTEYDSCPDNDQQQLADEFAAAGASAVVGTHAHVLQGAGWRPDGVYVAYGLSNYLWWRSFGNEQDDNGVLTLTFDGKRVTTASFAPSHLDDTGVPVPATGAQADRINAQWEQVRGCAELSSTPPS